MRVKSVNYLFLQLTNTNAVNDVAWAPNMGRSYHLIASAGQDHHQQLKVSPTKRIFAAFIPCRNVEIPKNPSRIHARVVSNSLQIHRLLRTPDGIVPTGPAEVLAGADQPQGIWRIDWNVTGTVLASSGEEGVVRLWKSTFRGDWKEIKTVSSAK
jgi:nucleoporin SEH1